MNKRLITLTLLASLVLGCVSCGNESKPNPGNEAETTTEITTEIVTEKPFLDNLGEYDFEGADCTFLVRATRIQDLFPEDNSGDLVDAALYERNMKIGSRFNVNIKTEQLPDSGGEWIKAIQADVMSNSQAYDIVMPDYWWGCEKQGLFLNLLDYDEFDFDQPWWVQGWNDNATIGGVLFNAVGALSLDVIKNDGCVFFNKTVLDNFNLENPYDLVNNDEWTLDKMLSMAAVAYQDLNGDSKYDYNDDQIGFGFGIHYGRGFMTTFGEHFVEKTDDGNYEYKIFGNERFVDVFNAAYDITHNNDAVAFCTMNNTTGLGTDLFKVFKDDRLLFMGGFVRGMDDNLAGMDNFRDMKGDYGIVPSPKFDENQEDYISYNFGTSFISLPKTTKDPVMCAVILEALNAESYKNTIPTYFQVALKEKYSRDSDTGKMLDIIYDSTYFDFTFVNSMGVTGSTIFDGAIRVKNNNISSYLESNRVKWETELEKFVTDRAAEIESSKAE